MRKLVYLTLLIFLCFLFSSCVTFRLEKRLRKLNPAIAEWYEYQKIRTEGAREEYYSRIAVANNSFSGEGKQGWRTDRGQVLLLCGFPQNIIHYPIVGRTDGNHSTEGYLYEVWEYYQQGYLTQYTFKYHTPNTWRRQFSSLFSTAGQGDFERRCRKLFAPTEDGWDLWGGVLLRWVKEDEIS